MIKVVGVRFKPAGKVYDFDAGVFVLNRGDAVIVETEQGLGFGFVAVPPVLRDENDIQPREDEDDITAESEKDFILTGEEAESCEAGESPEPEHKDSESDTGIEPSPPVRVLKKVFRPATPQDFEQKEKNAEFEKQARKFCMKTVKEFRLKMNLFAVESSFDASKLTFFFTADGRVDFRELVKILVKEFHTRIEMRQVGIRNQAKMCGGLGRCGRELCCAAFIEKFEPVSIRMAKEQNLSLNPTKISGLCGRLMCCLTYEYETYMAIKADMPKLGEIFETPKAKGRVIRQNPICGRVLIRTEEGQEIETALSWDKDGDSDREISSSLEKENKAELKRELNCYSDDPEEEDPEEDDIPDDFEEDDFPEQGQESELES